MLASGGSVHNKSSCDLSTYLSRYTCNQIPNATDALEVTQRNSNSCGLEAGVNVFVADEPLSSVTIAEFVETDKVLWCSRSSSSNCNNNHEVVECRVKFKS